MLFMLMRSQNFVKRCYFLAELLIIEKITSLPIWRYNSL